MEWWSGTEEDTGEPRVWKDICGVGRLSCVLISRPLFLGSGLPGGRSSDYSRKGGHPGSWSDSKWYEVQMSLAGMETWPLARSPKPGSQSWGSLGYLAPHLLLQ